MHGPHDDKDLNADAVEWSPAVALRLSAEDGRKLTDKHWKVIYFIRDYYEKHKSVPMPRHIAKMLSKDNPEYMDIRKLYRLFGSFKNVCRYAGIQPSGCVWYCN